MQARGQRRKLIVCLAMLPLGVAAAGIGKHSSGDAPAPQRKSSSVATAKLGRSSRHIPQPTLQGLEFRQRVAGTVRSDSGVALPAASVCAFQTLEPCAQPVCAIADRNGDFEFRDLDPQLDHLVASAAGHLTRQYALVDIARSPNQLGSLKFTLERGGVEVTGSVVDASGGPVPFALVRLSPRVGAEGSAKVLSDSNGQFSAHVPEGEVEVSARAEAYSPAVRRVHAPARGVTLALAPAAAIVGRVVAVDTEEPIAGVRVTAQPAPGHEGLPSMAVSGEDGEFHLEGLIGGHTYTVSASSERWRGETRWVSLEVSRATEPLLLHVLPATTLSGRVLRDGEPCVGALVSAVGPAAASGQTRSSGSVQFDGLLPGLYQIEVSCPQALSQHDELEIGHDPISREWNVSRGLAVNGKVEDSRGSPVRNMVVVVQPLAEASDATSSTCVTDESGRFSCSGLAPGEYDCRTDDGSDAVRVSLGDTSRAPVSLRTRPAGSIHISVAPNSDEAPRPFTVFARSTANMTPIAATPRGDGFVLDRIPLGRYALYVDLPSTGRGMPEVALEHDGQVVEVRLASPRATAIEGKAVDQDGMPVADAWITVRPSGMPGMATLHEAPALTDEDGAFVVQGLVPGTYNVVARNNSGEGHLRGVAAGSLDVVVQVQAQLDPIEPGQGAVTSSDGTTLER